MRAWIFSDLHLIQPNHSLYQNFLNALSEAQGQGDHLVLAGDIFDVMVGGSIFYRRKFSEFFKRIDTAVKNGIKVHYIEGNHDFHVKGLFPKEVDFQPEAITLIDPAVASAKKLIYIAHGDLVDQEDVGYLKMRSVLRSQPVETLAALLPGFVTEKTGFLFSRSLEKKAQDGVSPQTRQKFRRFAQSKNEQGFDYVVLGHCHDLDEVSPHYFNMGYPPLHGTYLYYESKLGLSRRAFGP